MLVFCHIRCVKRSDVVVGTRLLHGSWSSSLLLVQMIDRIGHSVSPLSACAVSLLNHSGANAHIRAINVLLIKINQVNWLLVRSLAGISHSPLQALRGPLLPLPRTKLMSGHKCWI